MVLECLRQTRKPGKIGLALLQVGIFSLLTLFGHIVEHCCIAGEFLNTRQAIGIRVESRFQEAQRNRAFLKYLPCPLYGFFFQALQRHDGVDQSHIQGLLSCILPAEIPDLASLFMTNDTCHVGSPPTGIKTADPGTSLPKPGIIGGNRQITKQVEHVTAANGIACNHGYDWLGKILNHFLQVERVQARHAVAADVATMTSNTLIPARAERLITCACKNDHANLWVLATGIESIYQFSQCFWPESIAHCGSVDCNLSHALGFLKNNVCVVTNFLPFYRHMLLLFWLFRDTGFTPARILSSDGNDGSPLEEIVERQKSPARESNSSGRSR